MNVKAFSARNVCRARRGIRECWDFIHFIHYYYFQLFEDDDINSRIGAYKVVMNRPHSRRSVDALLKKVNECMVPPVDDNKAPCMDIIANRALKLAAILRCS